MCIRYELLWFFVAFQSTQGVQCMSRNEPGGGRAEGRGARAEEEWRQGAEVRGQTSEGRAQRHWRSVISYLLSARSPQVDPVRSWRVGCRANNHSPSWFGRWSVRESSHAERGNDTTIRKHPPWIPPSRGDLMRLVRGQVFNTAVRIRPCEVDNDKKRDSSLEDSFRMTKQNNPPAIFFLRGLRTGSESVSVCHPE